MIQTQMFHGAQYCIYDEPPHLLNEPICSHGFTINVGDKVCRIGKKVRTMFELNKGVYMKYEGIALVNGLRVALFDVPSHNEGTRQANMFEKPVQYRYGFHMVEVKGKFHCFLVGDKGCRDILMDDLELIN